MTFDRYIILPNGIVIITKARIWDHWENSELQITNESLLPIIQKTLSGFLERNAVPLAPGKENWWEEIWRLEGKELIFYGRARQTLHPLWPVDTENSFITSLPISGQLEILSVSSLARKTLETLSGDTP
ncbi:hypothetical protein HY373_00600 [Candidatus Berkelbacteria bacterium]|nr:hypothetical protein [Candidatus Berkelbacteria bacterium]MBI4029665.1 hypothetical protein [Candidatus Berkelbacteria bacterium]